MNRLNRPRMARIPGSSYDSRKGSRAPDGSTLTLDFTAMGALDPRITFTRADATPLATYINKFGYITTVTTAQQARFDFDPTTLVPKGLLIEAPSTNNVLYSQDFSQATWVKTNATVTPLVSAPDGTTTASTLTANASALIYQTHTATGSATSTYSLYVKQGTAAYCDMYVYDAVAGVPRLNVRYTFATKAFAITTGSSAIYQELPNGWIRISATNTTYSTTNAIISYLYVGFAVSGTTYYGWGVQMEAGDKASSYISTTTAAVTRAADTAIIAAGSNFSSWYKGGTIGTFVANWYGSVASTSARSVVATADVRNRHLHMYQTPLALTLRLADFGAAATATTSNSLTAGALAAGAFSYDGTKTSLCLNGGTVVAGTLAFTVAPTYLSIGGPSTDGTTITETTVMLNNSIRTLKYFPTRLSDGQIQGLTT